MSEVERDFQALLGKRPADLLEGKPPPLGYWKIRILKGELRQITGRAANAPYAEVDYLCKLLEPTDDVDKDEVANFGNIDELLPQVFRIPIFRPLDEANIRRFHERKLGHRLEDYSSTQEMVRAAKGAVLLMKVSVRVNPDDEDRPYVDLVSPLALGDGG